MPFKGHDYSDGETISSNETYTSHTHISNLSFKQTELLEQLEQSDHSDRSGTDSQEYISSQRWEPPSNLQTTSKMFYNNNNEEVDDSSSSSPISLPTASSEARTKSLYSFTDMDTSLKQMKSDSNGVPSLDLRSSTLDYMRDVKSLKLHREPQVAFETWFAAKKRQRQQQLQLQKKQLEQEELRKQQRKELAQLCYEQWLRNKARLAEERRIHNHMQMAVFKAESSVPKARRKSSGKSERSETPAEIRQVVQSWWMKKQQQQQRQREEKQYYLLMQRQEEQRRKQLAEKAFQEWISNVYEKPKPVPMNQGMDSLRGTISQIYVNPLPWQPLKKASKEDR